MQLKALACALGILLIVILLLAKLVFSLVGREEEPDAQIVPPLPPVVVQLKNIWIMEVAQDRLLVFREGREETYPFGRVAYEDGADEPYIVPKTFREQVADVLLTDGYVTEVRIKTEKVSGKVLSVSDRTVELEGAGSFPLARDAQGYRLYGSLSMCTPEDLRIGYDFQDFVLEDGQICAVLSVKEEAMESIRVLLKASDYSGLFHESVTFRVDTGYTIRYGAAGDPAEEMRQAGEACTIDRDSAYFQGERITVTPLALTGKITLSSVNRSQGSPSYRGCLELLSTPDGLVVLNEVLLEEYLYSVVPSEMPASYPEEALKAQAVCARTYAYRHMLAAGYPQYGAHVDDSTGYQVYQNIPEQEATTTAVKETYGQLLYREEPEELAETYYYSTSCGLGSDAAVWKSPADKDLGYLKPRRISRSAMEQFLELSPESGRGNREGGLAAVTEPDGNTEADREAQAMREEGAFDAFIRSKDEDDFECAEGWYRWTYAAASLDEGHMLAVLQSRYAANRNLVLTRNPQGEFVSEPIKELGTVTDLLVEKRGGGGVADELVIKTSQGTFKVLGEHNIRHVLNDGTSKVYRQDGSKVASPTILPSGFFVINTVKEKGAVTGYTLTGGGYGHGVGMSQNGAKAMAALGYSAADILRFFYEGCSSRNVYF
jgi:stage II sporulation protein D